jgi:hypothetical protein
MTLGKISFIGNGAAIAALVASMAIAAPSRAAEPVFPIGTMVGLVPPAGMVPSKRFPGFEDLDKHAAIIITELPPAAYATMIKADPTAELKKSGITVDKRETLQLAVGQALLLTGTEVGPDNQRYRKWLLAAGTPRVTALVSVQEPEQGNAYPDSAVRAALATLAIRTSVPPAELYAQLPFAIGDLAGFHVTNVVGGRAIRLSDDVGAPRLVVTSGLPQFTFNGRAIIVAVPSGPVNKNDRPTYARVAFNSIGGIKDIQFTMSEPVRTDGRDLFETVARAKDTSTGGDIMVVQWLLFGNQGLLQIVGISRADNWSTELPRFRTIRDSITLK